MCVEYEFNILQIEEHNVTVELHFCGSSSSIP